MCEERGGQYQGDGTDCRDSCDGPVSACCMLTIDPASGKCTDATLVLGAVGPKPVVATAASGLIGETLTPELFTAIALQAADETDPIADLRGPVWYKRRIAKVLVERALTCAQQKTQG